jgi:hypothetical protein
MIDLVKRKIQNLISDKKFAEILTGSSWALSAHVIAVGLGMVSSIIIARAYGAEVLGIVAVLDSFITLATIFTVLGTGTSILRLIPEHLVKYSPTSAFKVYRKTQYFVVGISVLTGSLLFFASGFIAETVFSKLHLRFYFALASVFIVFMSLKQLNTQAVRGLRLRDRLRSTNLQKPGAIEPEIEQQLRRFYRDDILKLQDYIGRDLSSWLEEGKNP